MESEECSLQQPCKQFLSPPTASDKPGKAKKSTNDARDRRNAFLIWLNSIHKQTLHDNRCRANDEDDDSQKLCLVAYDFLSGGAPYKGFVPFIPRHLYQHFELQGKYNAELGRTIYSRQKSYSQHCVSMLKEDQLARWDKESTSWIVANETTLAHVLNLYKNNYESPVWVPQLPQRYINDAMFKDQWRNNDNAHKSYTLQVLAILQAWEAYNLHLQEAAECNKRLRLEALERSNNTHKESTAGEIEQLKRMYGLTWDDALDKACAKSKCIGLPNTMSNCARLLRALKLKITTVERIYSTNPIEVRSEYAEMRSKRLRKRKKSFVSNKSTKQAGPRVERTVATIQNAQCSQHISDETIFEGIEIYEEQRPSNACVDLLCEVNILGEEEDVESDPTSAFKATMCTQCYGYVTDQFKDCYCGDGWELCAKCGYYGCEKLHKIQRCECKDEHFLEKQRRAVERVVEYEENVASALENYETFREYHPLLVEMLHSIAYKSIQCDTCKHLYESGKTLLVVKEYDANVSEHDLYTLQYNELVGENKHIDTYVRCALGFPFACNCWDGIRPRTQTEAPLQ